MKHLRPRGKEGYIKEESLKQLRHDLKLHPHDVLTEVRYHVSLPTEEAHHKTHLTLRPHLLAIKINPQIAQKVTELVKEEITDPQAVRKALKYHDRTVLRTVKSTRFRW